MDQTISSIIGAIIFAAFTGGLAESIGAVPFFVIVGVVILAMSFSTWQEIRGALRARTGAKSGQGEG